MPEFEAAPFLPAPQAKRKPHEAARLLISLVGRARLERATNGLKVRPKPYFTALIDGDRINTNQQVTSALLDK